MSEENLEALHKIVRAIRERKARLVDAGMNLTDILTRQVKSYHSVCAVWVEMICKMSRKYLMAGDEERVTI